MQLKGLTNHTKLSNHVNFNFTYGLREYTHMRPNLQIPTLLAHFTYYSSFERNYLIIPSILIFKVLLNSVMILQEICVI